MTNVMQQTHTPQNTAEDQQLGERTSSLTAHEDGTHQGHNRHSNHHDMVQLCTHTRAALGEGMSECMHQFP